MKKPVRVIYSCLEVGMMMIDKCLKFQCNIFMGCCDLNIYLNHYADADGDGDADAQVSTIARLILRIVELKTTFVPDTRHN